MGYLFYAVLLLGYLLLAYYLTFALARYNSIHFNLNPWLLIPTFTFIYIILGVLLGLDLFIGQARHKNGTWSINTIRLIVLGLPALYFSCYWMMYFGNIWVPTFLMHWLPQQLQQFFNISAVICGYVLITSFHKSKKRKSHPLRLVDAPDFSNGGKPLFFKTPWERIHGRVWQRLVSTGCGYVHKEGMMRV